MTANATQSDPTAIRVKLIDRLCNRATGFAGGEKALNFGFCYTWFQGLNFIPEVFGKYEAMTSFAEAFGGLLFAEPVDVHPLLTNSRSKTGEIAIR